MKENLLFLSLLLSQLLLLTTIVIYNTVGCLLLKKYFLVQDSKTCFTVVPIQTGEMTWLLINSGWYDLLLQCQGHSVRSSRVIGFFPSFPLLPGSCPDDEKGHETKALFSCPCAQEWPRIPNLSHLPSEDDQIMSNTSRLQRTQEISHSLVPRTRGVHTGLVCPPGLQGRPALSRPLLSSSHSAVKGRAY